ncbi:hypothetical protein D3C75_710590 [compost metagenome]
MVQLDVNFKQPKIKSLLNRRKLNVVVLSVKESKRILMLKKIIPIRLRSLVVA